jgi:hypothetical protein
MEPGDMNSSSVGNASSPGIPQVKTQSRRQGLVLACLTALIAAGVICSGTMMGLAKDKQPTTRIVNGTVYDDAQNIIEGATIELTDVQTGKVLDIYSGKDGQYQYSDLKFDHDYTIKAMFKGVSSEVRHISILETRWTLVLNLTIPKPTN